MFSFLHSRLILPTEHHEVAVPFRLTWIHNKALIETNAKLGKQFGDTTIKEKTTT